MITSQTDTAWHHVHGAGQWSHTHTHSTVYELPVSQVCDIKVMLNLCHVGVSKVLLAVRVQT